MAPKAIEGLGQQARDGTKSIQICDTVARSVDFLSDHRPDNGETMKKTVYLPSLIVLLLVGSTAFAQDQTAGAQQEPPAAISTDRPSFSAGSSTVPSGRFQLESGLGFEYEPNLGYGHEGTKVIRAPNLSIRIGLLDFVEIRAGANMAADFTNAGQEEGGDLSLGTKLGVELIEGWSLGMLGFGTLDLDSQEASAGATLLTDVSVSERVSLTANFGFVEADLNDLPEEDDDPSIHLSALAAFSLTDAAGMYVEWYLDDKAHFADLGATYLLTSTLQLDVYYGLYVGGDGRFNDDQYHFGGFGVSKLF
jgi:hypothetical protein